VATTNLFDPAVTPNSFAYDAGVLSAVIGGERRAIGITRGGIEFNPNVELRQPEADGIGRHMIAGLDRVTKYQSELSTTIVTIDAEVIALLGMGATAGGVTTPTPAGTTVPTASLIEAPWLELVTSGGDELRIEFDYGAITEWSMSTEDQNEAEVELTIQARVDPTRPDYTTNLADYRIVTVAA
jgi:hypothetical protein